MLHGVSRDGYERFRGGGEVGLTGGGLLDARGGGRLERAPTELAAEALEGGAGAFLERSLAGFDCEEEAGASWVFFL